MTSLNFFLGSNDSYLPCVFASEAAYIGIIFHQKSATSFRLPTPLSKVTLLIRKYPNYHNFDLSTYGILLVCHLVKHHIDIWYLKLNGHAIDAHYDFPF